MRATRRGISALIPTLLVGLALVSGRAQAAGVAGGEPPWPTGQAPLTQEAVRFGPYELGVHPTLPDRAEMTFEAAGGPAEVRVWQGEGHAWSDGCTPGVDGRSPCDQNQPHEVVKFVLNGQEIGRFVDHSPEDDQSYFYTFRATLAPGQNVLQILHTHEPGGANSVFVKGALFTQPSPGPGATPEPAPPPPGGQCEETPFHVAGRVISPCGADRPALEITQLYQPSFAGAARRDGLPRDGEGRPVPTDGSHWIDAALPAVPGWSRQSVQDALWRAGEARGLPGDHYERNPGDITWALIMDVFGADRIEGYYVHVADSDDNCGAVDGTQGGTDAQRESRWQLIPGAAQFQPTCDQISTSPEPPPADAPPAAAPPAQEQPPAQGSPSETRPRTPRSGRPSGGSPADAAAEAAAGAGAAGPAGPQAAPAPDASPAGAAQGSPGSSGGAGSPARLPTTGGDGQPWLLALAALGALGAGVTLRRRLGR